MKIVVACGGTGGHTFPGLAVAEELVRRGHEVIVWASGRAIESSVMKHWKGRVFSTGAKQLTIRNLFAIFRSILCCRKEMKRERPAVLLAMGSYASLPPVLAARTCRVTVYLHEANTVPGKAVDFLAKFAKAVAVSFDVTPRYLPNVRTVHTGLPIRSDIAKGSRFPFIPVGAFVVFVTGGSQGAHTVNELSREAVLLMKDELARRPGEKRPLYVIHQTGLADESSTAAIYQKASIPSRVHAFELEMADAFASADLVIARAGASTCFELAACGKPALLIPLPTAIRDHQHFNAETFAAAGAADEAVQGKISARQLSRYLLALYDNPKRREAMSSRMRRLAIGDAASRVANLVLEL